MSKIDFRVKITVNKTPVLLTDEEKLFLESKLHYPKCIYWYNASLDNDGLINALDVPYKNSCLYVSDSYCDIQLMQYTGAKDKHGQKIYEGDIITSDVYLFKDDGEDNYHGVVYYDDYDYCFKLELHCVNKNKGGISHGITELLSARGCQFEVLGNIHDNPELLKWKDE